MKTLPDEITFTDNYGEERIVHQNQGRKNGRRLQVKRQSVTPALALNSGIGVLLGARIRAAREAKGWGMTKLARAAGIGAYSQLHLKQRMYEIEKGVRKEAIRFGTLYAIAMALGIEAATLLPTVEEVKHIAAPQKRSEIIVEVAS
jgi:transcriptional regulator with XRE-family HTH domain